ncbi:replication initiator protein [Dipodfec virus RodF1_63]|uniref:Replication initiator protein n=1 Tax=Dipodfec virus RodF1_63 TaxID=2929305 RepID=A0A976N2Z5_9VIRU|nr:replication initiator protein [Dipodfec virus RodF1_63]
MLHNGSAVAADSSFVSSNVRKIVRDFVQIPCGKCIGCRLAYSRQWADRCMIELGYHADSWFVTLTYDDDHLPLAESIDEDTGEYINTATLKKRDIQLFFKRLRKNYKYDNPLRYYCAGEYGSQTYRPHYHAIIFGLKLDDLRLYKQSLDGYNYYNSSFVSRCWSKGHVVIGQVTWDTCAYTARYIMKKQYGDAAKIYEKYNIQPEFTTMSLKPAIGRSYFDEKMLENNGDYISLLKSDIWISTSDGGRRIKPPRYYDRLVDRIETDLAIDGGYVQLKEQRKKFAEDMNKIKLQNTSLPYLEMLAVEEENKLASIKTLKRKEF